MPRDESEARDRIVAAATRCVDRLGAKKTNIAAVATELGVTRQTVYRYFPTLPDLLAAVAETGAEQFLVRMGEHLAAVTTPEEAVTESIVFALNAIPSEPYIGLLLQAGANDMMGRGVTSAIGMSYGAQMLGRMPVDWSSVGVAEDDLEPLAEIIMRLVFSFMEYPVDPPRTDDEVRLLVRRWLGPALAGGHSKPTQS